VKDDRLYLHHMRERCHRITRFIAPGKQAFRESEALQDAVIRNVEVIGEAAKRVTAATRARMPELDWKAICGIRDVLIHDYIGDLDEVWNVASLRIPELQATLEQQFPDMPGVIADGELFLDQVRHPITSPKRRRITQSLRPF